MALNQNTLTAKVADIDQNVHGHLEEQQELIDMKNIGAHQHSDPNGQNVNRNELIINQKSAQENRDVEENRPMVNGVDDNHQNNSELRADTDDVTTISPHESNTVVTFKLIAIFSTLYFFMFSSGLLSKAFELASYHYTGYFIRNSGFLQNPFVGLMVGIVTTVIFQSSGAVTSVLVTIVGSGFITVRESIPIIMGANVGTSVTNTVVSLIVYKNKSNLGTAITAGIVHDMYNMMSVIFMLPVELLFHPLEVSSKWIMELVGGPRNDTKPVEIQFLNVLVKPLVNAIILIDKNKTSKLKLDEPVDSEMSLIKRCCKYDIDGNNQTFCSERCSSLFSVLETSDNLTCILVSIIAMITLFSCLIMVVKVTKSLLGGKLLNWVKRLAQKEYRYPYSMLVGYLFILVGMVITIILHSSGVFTSMLVPLAGGDVLSLMQIYELTLGSNVGTTFTGILAALSADSKFPIETLQVALCHFIFNIAGILIFYSIPNTELPILCSKYFGVMTVKNIWFSICYLLIVFIIAPVLTVVIYLSTT